MTPLQVLAACGLISGALCSVGGFWNIPFLVGLGSLTMLIGNVYALHTKDTHGKD